MTDAHMLTKCVQKGASKKRYKKQCQEIESENMPNGCQNDTEMEAETDEKSVRFPNLRFPSLLLRWRQIRSGERCGLGRLFGVVSLGV